MREREEAEEITIQMRMAQEIDFSRPDPVAGELNIRAKLAIQRGLLDPEMYQTLVDYSSMRLKLRAEDRERVKRHKAHCRSTTDAIQEKQNPSWRAQQAELQFHTELMHLKQSIDVIDPDAVEKRAFPVSTPSQLRQTTSHGSKAHQYERLMWHWRTKLVLHKVKDRSKQAVLVAFRSHNEGWPDKIGRVPLVLIGITNYWGTARLSYYA